MAQYNGEMDWVPQVGTYSLTSCRTMVMKMVMEMLMFDDIDMMQLVRTGG